MDARLAENVIAILTALQRDRGLANGFRGGSRPSDGYSHLGWPLPSGPGPGQRRQRASTAAAHRRCSRVRGAPPVGRHRKNSFASETPVTDGESVFVYIAHLG